MLGKKTRSLGQILEKFAYAIEATFSVQYSLNLVGMFVLMNSWTTSKRGHIELETRSAGEILEKLFVHHREEPILITKGL